MSRFRLTLLSAFLTQCGRSACNSVQLRTISTISRPQNSPGYLFRIPYYLPLRWKSKSKGKLRTTALSKDKLPTDLLEIIRADEMNLEFEATLTRFKSALQQKLALKITPQMLADLTIPDAHVKLGQVASLVSQQDKRAAGGGSINPLLLIDLTARPDLVAAARKVVSQFIESTNHGSASSLIESAGHAAFTVRLRAVITKESREELIHKGQEMLNQVKREMDRIYQAHDKLVPNTPEGKKHHSEDHLFSAREYLRSTVKQNHALATALWEKKHVELSGS
ncbi:hypothetical protein FBUS_08458 [Fasciolopsis buskii]|uniref:Ribosome recycling factor domain-containing protein n=1 Tax=Fasciolopsis buskii TaxID=27845 RepID=A0A8E0S105_9TREM|nr:hypothetical protein FBUS_08458 [Fasciolopsis buski]